MYLGYYWPGVILKMARLIREDTEGSKGELVKEAARKPPIRTIVIQGKDFVQIIAKVSSALNSCVLECADLFSPRINIS